MSCFSHHGIQSACPHLCAWPARARQVNEPAAARAFLDAVDQEVATGKLPHRVSLHFAGTGTGTLRSHMEAFANGRGLHPLLQSELLSYQCVLLDDSLAESTHRDVSCEATRSRSSKLVWWSSSARLAQNLQLEAGAGHAAIHWYWRRWKVLLQKTWLHCGGASRSGSPQNCLH